MNHGEEQRNELEALSEIYYNEIEVISNKPPISFSINVRPQASNYEQSDANGNDDGSDDDDGGDYDSDNDGDYEDEDDEAADGDGTCRSGAGLSVKLSFELPPKYPEEIPSIQILESNNLDEEELEELMSDLSRKAREFLGTVMVFMLVSDVVEWLITKSEKGADEAELEKEMKQKEIEAEEAKRFEGTPVTEQSFLTWKAKFDAEIIKANLELQKRQQTDQGSNGPKRLTGRAMFESDKTLAESDLNFVEDLDQNQIEALLLNIEEVDIQDEEDDFDPDLDLEDCEEYGSEEEEEDDEDDDDDSDEGPVEKSKQSSSKTQKLSSKR